MFVWSQSAIFLHSIPTARCLLVKKIFTRTMRRNQRTTQLHLQRGIQSKQYIFLSFHATFYTLHSTFVFPLSSHGRSLTRDLTCDLSSGWRCALDWHISPTPGPAWHISPDWHISPTPGLARQISPDWHISPTPGPAGDQPSSADHITARHGTTTHGLSV